MKKKIVLWGALVVVALGCVIAVVSTRQSATEGIAAVYGAHEITLEAVEHYRETVALTGGEAAQSDREVVDLLLRNLILSEEAERRGLAATQEEIQAQLDATRQWYEENETVRQGIDDYCAGAGISFEEYWSIMEEQLPGTIARAKLVGAVGEEEVEQIVAQALKNVTYYGK